MATLTLRNVKGSSLTFDEMDNNLTNVNNELTDSISYLPNTTELVLTDIGGTEKKVSLEPIIDDAVALAIALG